MLSFQNVLLQTSKGAWRPLIIVLNLKSPRIPGILALRTDDCSLPQIIAVTSEDVPGREVIILQKPDCSPPVTTGITGSPEHTAESKLRKWSTRLHLDQGYLIKCNSWALPNNSVFKYKTKVCISIPKMDWFAPISNNYWWIIDESPLDFHHIVCCWHIEITHNQA